MKTLIWPLDKVTITQGFGERPEYYKKYGLKGHNGIDLRTRYLDTPLGKRYVQAMADGKVVEVRRFGSGYGTYVKLLQKDGSTMTYAHLYKSYVYEGQNVTQGQKIALTDNTGDSSAPHLHITYKPKNPNMKNGFFGAEDPTKLIKT